MIKLWSALFAVITLLLAAHLALADGLFKVGEKAPSFLLAAITGEKVEMKAYGDEAL